MRSPTFKAQVAFPRRTETWPDIEVIFAAPEVGICAFAKWAQSNAAAAEPYPAFDSALTRLSGRLRRHKTKIKQHHHENSREQAASVIASSFVLQGDDHQEEVNDNPTVVAEMTTPVETLTVGEAVMRLDLADLPALLFRNKAHSGLNMIYRRPDGHIGWVDPAESAKAR